MFHRKLAPLLAAIALLAGCSEPAGETSSGSPCDGSTVPVDEYVAGLARAGKSNAITFHLSDALPSPPGRGTNRWVVDLTDGSGAALPGGKLTNVKPWMPDHGHGSGVKPTFGETPEGDEAIEGLEFVMPGVWTVTLTATSGTASDEATFAFCIDG